MPTVSDLPNHNKSSLVQDWLKEIQAPQPRPVAEEEYQVGKKPRGKHAHAQAQSTLPPPDDWKPHGLHLSGNYLAADSLPGAGEGRKKHKYQRGLDEDSSIIAPLDDHHRVRDRVETHSRRLPAIKECYYERGKKMQAVSEASSIASGVISHADHHFEKRARRRTRDDRYDTTKVDNATKEKKSKKIAGKKNRKRDKLSSAREVMDNFNSNTILNDRITVSMDISSWERSQTDTKVQMQPSLRPGLFDNGRASRNQRKLR